MLKIKTINPEETKALGYKLGKALKGGDVLCLMGDLGAGKTTLTQSIAEGLGVDDYVTSPTFTLVNEYEGRYPVYHFDVYRLNDIDEVYDIGFEEYVYSNGVTIIEWANMIEEVLPKDRLEATISKGEDNEREILIEAKGLRYRDLIEELKK